MSRPRTIEVDYDRLPEDCWAGGPSIGYAARGQHDPAEFAAAVEAFIATNDERAARVPAGRAQVRYERLVPYADPDTRLSRHGCMVLLEADGPVRGAYATTWIANGDIEWGADGAPDVW